MQSLVRVTSCLLAALVGLSLAGCSQPAGTASSPASSSSGEAVAAAAVLVDVRTPEEFSEGHLAGAVNVPLQTPDFASAVAALTSGPVDVYCRSGNRSAQAVEALAAAGVSARDLGGFDAAQRATGLSVER